MITESISDKECHAQDSGQEFNHRVVNGDSLVAVSALSAKKNVAHYGDVVVEFNSAVTTGTARGREDDGFSEGDPVNADIQEASDAHTDKKNIPINDHW